jgi:hypothetical protein
MKTFIILGMHRSATSLIARSLHGECYLGSDDFFIPPAFDNPKGFFEDRRVVLLNDELLKMAGGAWDNPPSKESILELKGKPLFDSTVDEYIKGTIMTLHKEADGKSVGIKDPRMCLLIDLWDQFIPNPQYIMTYRNPKDIVKSLEKRSETIPPIKSSEEWMQLTKEITERANNFIQNKFTYNLEND